MFDKDFADSIKNRLQALVPEYEAKFLERDELIRMLLLTIMSKSNAFLIGLPGLAKSDILDKICFCIEEYSWYEKLFTNETKENSIFGPIISGDGGSDKYATRGMLPEANFALLDEVFKSPKELLDSMLQAINEKKFKNGPDVQKVPLYSVFAAANELPKERNSPFFDRLHFRYQLLDIQDPDNFIKFMEAAFDRTKNISFKFKLTEIDKVNEQKEFVVFPHAILDLLLELWDAYKVAQIRISTRTWGFLREILKVSAVCNGRDEVNYSDVFVLLWACWNDFYQREKNQKLIYSVVFGVQDEVDALLNQTQESWEKISSSMQEMEDFLTYRKEFKSGEDDEFLSNRQIVSSGLEDCRSNIAELDKIRNRFFMTSGIESQVKENIFLPNEIRNNVFNQSNIGKCDYLFGCIGKMEVHLSSFLDKNKSRVDYQNSVFYFKSVSRQK